MRRRLLDIHLYLSLFCAGYFIIYGISSLGYNRRMNPAYEADPQWERVVRVPDGLTPAEAARSVAGSLGLFGKVVEWTVKEADGTLSFRFSRPGRSYEIDVDRDTGRTVVHPHSAGLYSIILTLHYTRFVPGSLWGTTWGIYAWTSMLAMLFAVLAGMVLWWTRVPERRTGLTLLGIGSGGSLLLILYMSL